MKNSFSSFLRIAALLAVTVFPWTGCYETPYDPSGKGGTTDVPSAKVSSQGWLAVPEGGGTVDYEELVFDFPSDAFIGDSQVNVSTVKKNPFSDYTLVSNVYQVVFPSAGTQKPVDFKMAYDGKPEDVIMMVQTPTYSRSALTLQESSFPIDFTVSDGFVHATIPATEDTGGHEAYFRVALVSNNTGPDDGTKAGDTPQTDFSGNFKFYGIQYEPQFTYEYFNKLKALEEDFNVIYIPMAFKSLSNLGFDLPATRIPFEVTFLPNGTWGQWDQGSFFKTWGVIYINRKDYINLATSFPRPDATVGEVRKTVVHELLHAVHSLSYDNRCAWTQADEGQWGDQWSMLSEALATWVEKTTNDGKISSNCIEQADVFLNSFWPLEKDKDTYQNHGYGMGLFIEWLSQKTSNKKIVKLLQYQKEGEKSLADVYNRFLKEEGISFFTPEDYIQFIDYVVNGKLDSRIAMPLLALKSVSVENAKSFPQVDASDVYSYGATFRKVRLSPAFLEDAKNEDKYITISQDREDMLTKVCLLPKTGLVTVGQAVKGKHFRLSMKTIKESGNTTFYVYSVRAAKQEPDLMVSRINFDFGIKFNYLVAESVVLGYSKFLYTSWSSSDIIVSETDTGTDIKAENSSGTLSFHIRTTNGKYGDMTTVIYQSKTDSSKDFSASNIAITYSGDSASHWSNSVYEIRADY